jgi:hypothetical protein
MLRMEGNLILCAKCWLHGVGMKHQPVKASGKKAKET